jgi:hypothetical protein
VLHSFWPGEIRDVVFVVGCPRSGTSVFGRILGHYPDLFYMHEPRYIWRQVNPALNVWRGHETRGRLAWDAGDVNEQDRRRLARWFHLALALGLRRRLVEKMPLNVFRLPWLASTFPEAQFIHVIRHARDAALSLQEAVGRWFSAERGYEPGHWASSWNYLMFEEYAEGVPELQDKVSLVRAHDDDYARALLVWLCSVWAGCRTGRELGESRYLEVRYEFLVADPAAKLHHVFDFLDEPPDPATVDHARAVLHGRSLRKPDPNPQATRVIAGDLLAELGYEV